MQVRIFCGGQELPVSPFVGRFVGNVCSAVVASLKAPKPARTVLFDVGPGGMQLEVDDSPVVLDRRQGFAGTIVHDTVAGMLQHLKGIDPAGTTRVEITLEAGP
jgi:hypothetical protein